jgi:hypothetical protein
MFQFCCLWTDWAVSALLTISAILLKYGFSKKLLRYKIHILMYLTFEGEFLSCFSRKLEFLCILASALNVRELAILTLKCTFWVNIG